VIAGTLFSISIARFSLTLSPLKRTGNGLMRAGAGRRRRSAAFDISTDIRLTGRCPKDWDLPIKPEEPPEGQGRPARGERATVPWKGGPILSSKRVPGSFTYARLGSMRSKKARYRFSSKPKSQSLRPFPSARTTANGKALGASFEDLHDNPLFAFGARTRAGTVDAVSDHIIGRGKVTSRIACDW
jgi:hypothetical protein